jgi:hypothetical protein
MRLPHPAPPASEQEKREFHMPQGNQPVVKFRIGLVTATVWQNEKHFNTVLSKSYKDDAGDWKETDQLGHADLMNAIQVLKRSEDFIADQH